MTLVDGMKPWVTPVLVIAAVASLASGASGATTVAQLVGSYSVISRFQGQSDRSTMVIDRYDRSTGRVSGHGGQGLESMTGAVSGNRITMRLALLISPGTYVGYEGTIHADGTISGRLGPTPGVKSGAWKMTPLPIVIQRVGYTVLTAQHEVSWGVEVRNASSSRSATGVILYITALSRAGTLITDRGQGVADFWRIGAIPPGATVYLGHVTHQLVDVGQVATLDVTPDVGSWRTGGEQLPRIADVRLHPASRTVTAIVTNPYRTPMRPYKYIATAVLYGRGGQIISGGDSWYIERIDSGQTLMPGHEANVRVAIRPGVPLARIRSARLTVAPG